MPRRAVDCPPSLSRRPPQEQTAIATQHFRHNHQIRISPVRLIDEKNEMCGVVPTAEALRKALDAGLDLVEVAPNVRPPVCKILDYGKWKYQQSKKGDKVKAKSSELKEVKIKTIRIGDHDLQIKVDHARAFLIEGDKVQFTLQFRGREITHPELGMNIMRKVRDALLPICKVEQDAKFLGRRLTMVLMPDAAKAKLSGVTIGSPEKPKDAKPAEPQKLGTRARHAAAERAAELAEKKAQRAANKERAGEGLNLPVPVEAESESEASDAPAEELAGAAK